MEALWPEQQLLTAKYLTFFMLMDPFFNTKDFYVEMMYAAVGNMFCEAYPGKTERYNERHNPEKPNKDYMLATLQRSNYEELADIYKGCANTMEAVNLYYALPNGKIGETITLEDGQTTGRQGFGLGMCQFTFSRATDVMESYRDIYGDYKGSLTLGQRFAAEYNLMRKELNSAEEYDNLIMQSEISSKQFEADKIYSLGVTFRKIYANPGDKSKYKDGGERAVKWYQILEEALYSATD